MDKCQSYSSIDKGSSVSGHFLLLDCSGMICGIIQNNIHCTFESTLENLTCICDSLLLITWWKDCQFSNKINNLLYHYSDKNVSFQVPGFLIRTSTGPYLLVIRKKSFISCILILISNFTFPESLIPTIQIYR